MRVSAIWGVLAVSGLVALTGCGSMEKMAKEAQAEAKEVGDVKKNVEAAKKGDLSAGADAATVIAVKAELAKDPATKAHNFNVESKGGEVTISGSGPADAKTKAEGIAKGVKGVSKVNNKITVDGK